MSVFKHFHLSPIDACMAIVMLCCMIDLLGLSLSIPILANYARDVQGNPPGCPITNNTSGSTNNTAFLLEYNSPACQKSIASIKANTGLLTTAYAFASLISTMWMPVFSDKFGPRNAIIISIFGSVLGFLGQAFTCPTLETSPNSTCIGVPGGFGLLVAVRALGGLFGGTISVAAAFIVVLYPQKQRGQQFAKMSACALSAFVFGPFVGGGLAQFGLRIPLYFAGASSILAMLLAMRYVIDPEELLASMKKKRKKRKNEMKGKSRTNSTNTTIDFQATTTSGAEFVAWKEIRVWLIAMQTMLTTLAFNGLSSLIALVLLEERLNVVSPMDSVEVQGQKVALWVMAYVPTLGFTQVFIVMGLFPRLNKKLGLLQTGFIGTFFIAVALFLIPFYSHPAMVFITQVLLAFGNGLQTNVSNTYLSKFAPKGKAATTLSYGTMADTVGNIIGPQLTQIYLINASLPFFIASGFSICSGLIIMILICIGDKSHSDYDPKHKKKQDKELSSLLLTNNPVSEANADADADASSAKTGESHPDKEAERSAATTLTPLLLSEQDRMDAMNISERVHPACFFTGEVEADHHIKYTTEAMSELSHHLYGELLEKQHMWGLRSGISRHRKASLQAHKDMITMNVRSIPPPNDDDNDVAFKEGIALFLSETGHEDWAMTIPGINVEAVLDQFRVPH